jgi:hypothetical protein
MARRRPLNSSAAVRSSHCVLEYAQMEIDASAIGGDSDDDRTGIIPETGSGFDSARPHFNQLHRLSPPCRGQGGDLRSTARSGSFDRQKEVDTSSFVACTETGVNLTDGTGAPGTIRRTGIVVPGATKVFNTLQRACTPAIGAANVVLCISAAATLQAFSFALADDSTWALRLGKHPS